MRYKIPKIGKIVVAAIFFLSMTFITFDQNKEGKLTLTATAKADEENVGLFGSYTEDECDPRYDIHTYQSSHTAVYHHLQTNGSASGSYQEFELVGTVETSSGFDYTYNVTTYSTIKAKQIRCPGWYTLCGSMEVDCGEH